jgi:hypothetical protein
VKARRRALAATATLIATALAVSVGPVLSDFTASTENPGNTVTTATMQYTHEYGSSTCTTVPTDGIIRAASSFLTCAGSIYPATLTAATQTDNVTNNSPVDAAAPDVTASLQVVSSCGPVTISNIVKSTNPMLIRGTIPSYRQPGPFTTPGFALTLGGSTYASAVLPVVAGGTNYSVAIWFRSSTPGSILSAAATTTNTAGGNFNLWLDDTGHVVFGLYASGYTYMTSAANTYLDNNWHQAIVTLSATGSALYVDKAAAVTSATPLAMDSGTRWHLGWSNIIGNGWPNAPSSAYFTGSLAQMAVFQKTLTAAQVTTLNNTTSTASAGAYTSAVNTIVSNERWQLTDSGSAVFNGPYPVSGGGGGPYATSATTSLCTMIDYSWNGSAPMSLRESYTSGGATIDAAPPATTQNNTLTLSPNAGYASNSGYLAGLNIWAPILFTVKAGNGAWKTTFSFNTQAMTFVLQ